MRYLLPGRSLKYVLVFVVVVPAKERVLSQIYNKLINGNPNVVLSRILRGRIADE